MRNHLLKKTLLGSISALAILPAGVASAQEQGPQLQLEEIVVTARRAEENVMSVPIAITAVTAETIEQRGIENVIQLSEFTPGMFSNVQNHGNGRMDRSVRRISFRGLSAASQGAGIFIDGAPYGGSAEPFIGDVARVEVLKGPQSVYFGRSTFAGAVNYITKDPTSTFTGSVSGEMYTYNGADGRIAFSGPIIQDKLGFRVALRHYTFGGQYQNGIHNGDMLGAQKTTAATVSLMATPTDNLRIRAYYGFSRDDDGTPVAATIKTRSLGNGPVLNCQLGGTGGKYWCGELPNVDALDPLDISYNDHITDLIIRELIQNARGYPMAFQPTGEEDFGVSRDVHNANLRIDYDFLDGWSAGFIAAYSHTKSGNLSDRLHRDGYHVPNPLYPATPAALAQACATNNALCHAPEGITYIAFEQSLNSDYSLEGRITSPQDNRIRGTVGASLYNNLNPGGTNFGLLLRGRYNNAKTKSTVFTPAIFGGIYADVTEQLSLTFEGRYQWDRIGQQQLFPNPNAPLKDTFKSFAPRVSVDYQITDTQMAYASFSRGFAPGGFNTALQGLSAADLQTLSALGTNLTFDQETLDNFEVGLKGTWFDRRLRTVLSAYYMPWRGGQVSNGTTYATSAGGFRSISIIQNAGSVDMKGIELEFDALISDKLSLNGSFSWSDPKFKAYSYVTLGPRLNGQLDVTGNMPYQVPEWTWHLSPQYEDNLAGDWDWFARVDYRYRSRLYVDQHNVAWMGARHLFDVRAGVTKGDFSLDFYIKNLFNDKQFNDAVHKTDVMYAASGACPPCYTDANPPIYGVSPILNEIRIGLPQLRTFGLKASYNF
jgi:iron complex outermembrane receptor protein